MKNKTGKVYLVGAGPGDLGLITVRGKELLEKADVVVYDRLANPALLEWASQAEKIEAGRSDQAYTNRILAAFAQKGKNVVRLKGGDPLIFGRGGEEALSLRRKKIPFEIVPGITAGCGGPAYAGIPLTDRKFASSVTFVTAHESPEKKTSAVPWEKLAHTGGTLVLYMGVKRLADVTASLLRSGMPGSTPVCVIEKATLPVQRIIEGTLKSITEKVIRAGVRSPSITVIGKVTKLRRQIRWYEQKPLYGKTVLVTRASHQAGSLVSMLEEQGAQVLKFAAIDILPPLNWKPVDQALERLKQFDWAVFTSVNGVEYFFKRLHALGKDARVLASNKLAVIGEATAQALEARGLKPDLVPDRFTSEGLVRKLRKTACVRGNHFLLARTDIAPPYLREELRKSGARVTELVVYRTVMNQISKNVEIEKYLREGRIDFLTFTSSSTVESFAKGISAETRRKIKSRIVSIGPVTTRTLKEFGFKPWREAREQTLSGLVEAMTRETR